MKRTAIEWVEFLNTDDNQRFGIKSYGHYLGMAIKDYLPANEFVKTFKDWMNDPVAKVWHNNFVDEQGIAYHLLEVD
mgnify:FL=1